MIDGWVTNLHPIREGHLQHNIVRPFFRLVGRWCFAFWLVSLGNGLPRVEPSKLWSTSTIMWLKKGDASEPEHETGGPVMLSSSPLWLVKNDWKLGPSRVGGEGRAFHLSPVLFSAEKSISISWGRGNLQSSSFLLNSVYFAIQKKEIWVLFILQWITKTMRLLFFAFKTTVLLSVKSWHTDTIWKKFVKWSIKVLWTLFFWI